MQSSNNTMSRKFVTLAAIFVAISALLCQPSQAAINYIHEISFQVSPSALTPSQALDGYTMLPQNLNSNARLGGKYVYLIYKTSPNHTDAYDNLDILLAYSGSSSSIPQPAGFQVHPQDLNEGAGGVFIYLATRKNIASQQGITDLEVTVGSQRGIYPSSPDFHRIPVDLNEGAGGDYVYLSYKLSPLEDVTMTQPSSSTSCRK